MHLDRPPLITNETSITDANKTIELADLPDPQPSYSFRLSGATLLWKDCQKANSSKNMAPVHTPGERTTLCGFGRRRI